MFFFLMILPPPRSNLTDTLFTHPSLFRFYGYVVTVFQYFDYQCPYCRKLHPAINALLANDKKVRVVYRVWPIFGAPSVTAAKAVLASRYQGKYTAFDRSEEHTSELQSLMRSSYAVFCLKTKTNKPTIENKQ